jgi:hypothetical protein
MNIYLRFRLAVFLISLLYVDVSPVFAQICDHEYSYQSLDSNSDKHDEEYAPTQRVAKVRSDRAT